MPQFDLDLNRVTYEHYVTAKAAINFPWTHTTSGGWHYLSYWNRETGQVKVSLAGIHYPDTNDYFDATGIVNASAELERLGWKIEHQVYIADHARAAADMAVAWALGQSKHCNVELAEWFPDDSDLDNVVQMLTSALPKLEALQRDRLYQWLATQTRQAD